jgi:hypothetical protein
LEAGFEKEIEKVASFLNRFENLKFSGRSGKFKYTHIHDMLRMGREIVGEYMSHGHDKVTNGEHVTSEME